VAAASQGPPAPGKLAADVGPINSLSSGNDPPPTPSEPCDKSFSPLLLPSGSESAGSNLNWNVVGGVKACEMDLPKGVNPGVNAPPPDSGGMPGVAVPVALAGTAGKEFHVGNAAWAMGASVTHLCAWP